MAPTARQPHVVFLGAPGVVYEEHPPPAELAPWIAVRWRIRADVAFDLRVVPDGCMDVVGDDVIGSFTRPALVALTAGDTASGVRFHPGGLPALLRIPASELVDLRVPLGELVPGYRSLRRLAADADAPDPLARAAYAAHDLGALARDSSYSQRHLRRRVLAATGHGPKRLMRIARMQRVLLAGRGESWARTAADHGYYDEAHMAGDIASLAGATPHALLG